jgi:hypothetical protein
MYQLEIIRNGETIKKIRRKRDLLTWRGQMVLANLLSQGAVGTATSTWYIVVSGNTTTPNMNDDSGDPEATEFSPLRGVSVTVSYAFSPSQKPNSNAQTYATFTVTGTVTVTSAGNVTKIGIRDNVATPNRHIIVEDAVVPQAVLVDDLCAVTYFLQMG